MRIYILACATISEDVNIAAVFDDLDDALEFMKERQGYHLIAVNVGFPMDLRYLSDYSAINIKKIFEERKLLEKIK